LNLEDSRSCLEDFASCVQNKELRALFDIVETRPTELINRMPLYGIATLIQDTAASLTSVSTVIPCLADSCANECASAVDCYKEDNEAWCWQDGEGIGYRKANPDDLKVYDLALDIIAEAPQLPEYTKAATEGLKALIEILKGRQPMLYIKVCWRECVAEKCRHLLLWETHYRKVCKVVCQWVLVPGPGTHLGDKLKSWYPLEQWPGRFDIIEKTMNEVLPEECSRLRGAETLTFFS